MKNVLAFDFGASSGRALVGTYSNNTITTKEVSRFSNDPVILNNTQYWDTLRHIFEIKKCIKEVSNTQKIDCIGIDTWAVDFGLIDKNGQLISNPVHYRDKRNEIAFKEFSEEFSLDELYLTTGIQNMTINSIFQLWYLHKYHAEIIEIADKFLMIPDLFAFYLTGSKVCELSNASTTALVDPKTHDWNWSLIKKLGFKETLFPKIVKAPYLYGTLSDEVCQELHVEKIPVISVCTHDTASAVISVPTIEDSFAYISCGTWSLLGTELKEPIINTNSAKNNYTNEIGINDSIRFLKNIMGLWIIQESKHQFESEGHKVTYDSLEEEAVNSNWYDSFIDCDDSLFLRSGNMPKRILEYCENTNQPLPDTRGKLMMCIYQSIALKYRYNIEKLENILGHKFQSIHMVGGGTKAILLCQLAANATGKPIYAGPQEATAYGNIVVQLMYLGEISSLKSAREIIKNSNDIKLYTPDNQENWNQIYQKYLNIIEKKA